MVIFNLSEMYLWLYLQVHIYSYNIFAPATDISAATVALYFASKSGKACDKSVALI